MVDVVEWAKEGVDAVGGFVESGINTAKESSIGQSVGNGVEAAKKWFTTDTSIKKITQEGTFHDEPVSSILVFPTKNNRTYRAGFIKLMAFSNDIALERMIEDSDKVFESKQHTKPHKKYKTNTTSDPIQYLSNAKKNLRKTRKSPGANIIFSAILPLPLSIKEDVGVEWKSEASAMNDALNGAYRNLGSNTANYLYQNSDMAKTLIKSGDTAIWAASKMLDGVGAESMSKMMGRVSLGDYLQSSTLGTNPIMEAYTGTTGVHNAAMNTIMGSVATNPSASMAITGINAADYINEGMALNGRRQIINDPGYWAKFQGVNPRSFNLSWEIIPENHQDALNGLMLCARLKEFSLPESVSTVEQLAPCYWNVEFSNALVDFELLYSDLVITKIDFNFADNGEFHLSGTPKKFVINITFQEARAPNSDVFKIQDDASGNDFKTSIKTSASQAIASLGDKITGGQAGSLGDILKGGNVLDKIKSEALDKLGGIKNQALGKLAGIAGDTITGITGGLADNAGGFIGGIFGDYAGSLISDTITNAADSATSVLVNAIATGDFKNLGDKMKDAALAGAAGTVLDAVGEVVGDVIDDISDYAFDKIGLATDAMGDWFDSAFGDATPEEIAAREKAREAYRNAKTSADKAKDMKEKLDKIEKNPDISAEDKKKAREKVQAEMKKAQEELKKAEAEKKKVEDSQKKREEDKKAEEASRGNRTRNETDRKYLEEILNS